MFWVLLLLVVLLYVLDRLNKNAGGDGIPVVGPLFDQALDVVGSVFNGNRRLTIDFSFREINDRHRRARATRRSRHQRRPPPGKLWRQAQNRVTEGDAIRVEPTLDTPLAEEPPLEHIEKTGPEIRELNGSDKTTDQQLNGAGKPRSHRHHHHHRHGHSERGAEGHRHNNKPHSERNKRQRRAKSERIQDQQH